jgi:hypothetical protein
MKIKLLVHSAIMLSLVGCSLFDDSTFTLYRSSVTDSTMRVHIATFDTDNKAAYNQENCDLARELFQNQQGVKVKFWCEKGVYRK